ncbi:MAG: transglycosylase domain-containing protein [bacterium]
MTARRATLRWATALALWPVRLAQALLGRLGLLTTRAVRLGLLFGLPAAAGLALLVRVLPYPVDQLSAGRGGPLILEDRHGNVLHRRPSEGGRPGRRGWVSLDEISPHALLTVVASEDSRFYEHHGVDPVGVLRAAFLNLRARRVVYGGSTITMQLARMVHSRGQPRTFSNKLKEAFLALRLERALDKRQILEQYLNRAYYGHGAYGIEAAAQRYFGKPAASLSVGEATFLAVIPRAPIYYDPIRHRDRVLRRREHVFMLLREQGLLTAEQARAAAAERVAPRLRDQPLEAPHFVRWVLQTLPAEILRHGGVVRTSLDLPLQRRLEERVAAHVASLRDRRVQQAGLVVLDTASGEVRAMVGSKGFWQGAGQLNIAVRRRHPGSALKPFVYALALEAGDTPASITYDINDVPTSRYRLLRVTQRERQTSVGPPAP